MKDSYSSDQCSISLLDSYFISYYLITSWQGSNWNISMKVCHGLAIHHPGFLSNHSDTISLLYKSFHHTSVVY
jgi:hypothetical protein